MRKILLTLLALLSLGGNGAWALSKLNFTSALDSKGNALFSGGYYRVLLPGRGASVAFKQNGDYVQAYEGLGIVGYMWKLENDGNEKVLISNPAGGYLKFIDYNEGHSKVKTNGTKSDCTAFEMAWCSSANKTIHLYDPTNGSYEYNGYLCGTVLSNHSGKGNNMGIYNNLGDAGSNFKFERFYQTVFTISEDVNGVPVESYPGVTINGNITATEYYTNSDNPITSFSTTYSARYYISGVEKTAEEVKNAINANNSTLTVTVKPEPFVASTNETPAYYALMISRNNNSWFEDYNGTVVKCAKDRSIPEDETGRAAWIWELKQNGTDGYRLYNVGADKYLGGRTATGGAFTLGDVASSNSFVPVYNSNLSVYDESPTIKFKDKTYNLWIDRGTVDNIGQPYAHTGGQEFTFLRMHKVTFSEGITVNSNDNVTTIFIKGDGNDTFTLPNNKLYSINGASAVGHAEAETAIAASSSNLSVTVSENTTKDVTYILKWSDGTTINAGVNVTAELLSPASDFVPSAFVNDFATLTYSPTDITAETTEVTVTASWNGPMQIADTYNAATAKWYVVDMHSSENQYTWKYDSSTDEIQMPVIAKNDYASITANNLFCFVGNPYTGFKIYNKAAGDTKTLRKETGNTIALMSAVNDHNLFKLYVATTATLSITNPYCFKLDGDTYYLNKQKKEGDSTPKLYGWTDTDEGSACRFFAPGEYHLAAMNSWNLEAPLGVVGTKAFINTQSQLDQLREVRTNISNDPFCVVGQETILNTIFNPVRDSESISLGAGYYRIINAYTSFATKPAWYYNSSAEAGAGRIRWSTSAQTDPSYQVNSIFKLTSTGNANEYYILSPNAQKSFKAATEDGDSKNLGYLDETPGAVTFTALNPATQFNLKVAGNTRALHAADHNQGAGTEGRIVSWNAGINTCSAWYILPVTAIDIPLNTVGSESYATLALPFGVTLGDGADAYYITIENGRAKANILSEKQIPAGMPVLLRSTTNASSITAIINDAAAATADGNRLVGTYTQLASLPDGNNYILGDGDLGIGFYKLGEGRIIAANKAYLNTDGTSVKGFSLDFGGEDAVKSIISESADCTIYDLSGRQVKTPARGLYIVNGKKVIVK